jgi:hypothetical protein
MHRSHYSKRFALSSKGQRAALCCYSFKTKRSALCHPAFKGPALCALLLFLSDQGQHFALCARPPLKDYIAMRFAESFEEPALCALIAFHVRASALRCYSAMRFAESFKGPALCALTAVLFRASALRFAILPQASALRFAGNSALGVWLDFTAL